MSVFNRLRALLNGSPLKKAGTKSWRLIQRLMSWIHDNPKTTIALISMILLSAAITKEFNRNVILIGTISVPGDISAKSGFTSAIVAERLIDEIHGIGKSSGTAKTRRAPAVERGLPDIEIPGANLSLRSFVYYLREFTGHRPKTVSGEFVREDGVLKFRLRVTGNDREIIDIVGGLNADDTCKGELRCLLKKGAYEIVRITDPYVLTSILLLGPRPEPEKAFELAQQILKLGPIEDVPWAQSLIGVMYAEGRGVKKRDYVTALHWFRMAAKQGIAVAQDNIGYMYASGLGVEPDFAEALRWFRKAAAQGSTVAFRHIADAYEHGRGVEHDLVRAYMWYRCAIDQEQSEVKRAISIHKLDGLKKKMTESQISIAEGLLPGFVPRFHLPDVDSGNIGFHAGA